MCFILEMNTDGFYKLGVKITGTRLTPIKIIGRKYGRFGIWYLCRCDCGVKLEPSPNAIRSGAVKSCGCYKNDLARSRKTHGLSKRPEYFAAFSAFKRCKDKSNRAYKNYGGKGIECLFESPIKMAEWLVAKLPKPKGDFLLDRIENDGNYEAGNLKWSTPKESVRNRGCTFWVTIRGVTKTLNEWAVESKLCSMTIKCRIQRDFPESLWLHRGQITKAVLFKALNTE